MIKKTRVTENDFLNYTDYAFKRLGTGQQSKGSGFLKNMLVWCVFATAFVFFFKVSPISLPLFISCFHWPSAALAAFPFVVLIVASHINMRKFRQLSIPRDNGLMLGEKTIEFNSEGIVEISQLGNCFYKWECVEAVEENNGDLYVFLDKLLALIIPSSSFSSDAEKEKLQALIKEHI